MKQASSSKLSVNTQLEGTSGKCTESPMHAHSRPSRHVAADTSECGILTRRKKRASDCQLGLHCSLCLVRGTGVSLSPPSVPRVIRRHLNHL